MTDESLAPFHRNRRRLPWKQRLHECSGKANRQLVKRNRPSSSGATKLRISSRNTSTRNGSRQGDQLQPPSSVDGGRCLFLYLYFHQGTRGQPEGDEWQFTFVTDPGYRRPGCRQKYM
ncbi:unnamed protein product [Protopolystoma xenopodis]|uniref:Uncharacterized protein n=1 Tax=Protopolystoma xenopodis TaxID=117903 RepID=A0A448WKB0_9PLAT|nr:unnamed protein product [Protopolystoma xenopodis]